MLSELIRKFLCCPLGINEGTSFYNALHFFLVDSIKISILLIVVISLMGVVNSYFPVHKVQEILTKRKWYGLENLLASALGAITPFCSCSSVPLFIGFLKGGIPLGVTLSFLITSPLVNEVAIVLFWGVFGIKVTLIYVGFGLFTGALVGFILGKLGLDVYLEDWVKDSLEEKIVQEKQEVESPSFKERLPLIRQDALNTFKKIFPYVLGGIFIGSLIHGYVPQGYFEEIMRKNQWISVPLVTIFAVPLYSNASGVIPVVQSLVAKGIPLGTALAFMMSVVGLSLPEAVLLKKVMQMKLLVIYFATITFSIIFFGYVFNFFSF